MSVHKAPALLVRADAMPGMGSGHIMRCRALATAARAKGWSVVMGGRCGIPWLHFLLEQENFLFLDGESPPREAPHVLLGHLEQMAHICFRPLHECAIVLDGYQFTTACQSAVRKAGRVLMVIDDYHHLAAYDCDMLLNPNPASEEYDYNVNAGMKLLGLDYALLRPEFNPIPARAGRTPSILLSLGGGDASAHLPVLAAALTLPALSGWTLRVIAGCMPTEAIKNALHGVAARLEILPRVDDMPSLLADTEICISAGGSTCWELCRMGIPFLTVEVAKNQHNICDWLDRHSYAPRFSSAAFMELLKNAELRSIRSTILHNLVDGYGTERVIKNLDNLFRIQN